MTKRVERAGLNVDAELASFVESAALPETGVSPEVFWSGFAALLADLTPKNRALLEKRSDLQSQIDAWHLKHKGAHDPSAYQAFLQEIGYLLPEGDDFEIDTQNVDPEIADVPGPQLVVPITNARFALNAVNARWGSLYDALYGTDAMGDLPTGKGYDAERGARVIDWAKGFLDKAVPLQDARWSEVTGLTLAENKLVITAGERSISPLKESAFVGAQSDENGLSILFENNGLKIRVHVTGEGEIGGSDPAGIADVWLESAMSTIMDCEDSVACVDGSDKVQAYTNWLGLMKGDLSERFEKAGKTVTRTMNPDQTFVAPDGTAFDVKARALLWVRNVGHLMTNPAILDVAGDEVFEGMMDAVMTVLIAMHDLEHKAGNSAHGSVYVVKPKMHGPEEVAFACEIFDRVEDMLGLPRNTVKIGIMDEERRTSANLKSCIRAAKSRVAFINTGFLDRTGDEIHTSMEAGPFLPKGAIKSEPWILSYEDRNVDIGLACGLQGRAQIGKGMWAIPDQMKAMLEQKIAHPRAGANCAWVPSPTAATLHATHYHEVDVKARQGALKAGGTRGTLDDLLTIPLMAGARPSKAEIMREVENNAQGILGYVVRWVDQGVGCSKVPDINDVGLMEDRATCRISAQGLANWLHHGVVDAQETMAALRKMAEVVDAQNAGDPAYTPMAPEFNGIAFQAACDLVFKGRTQPSGYTEPVLHARRLELKASL